MPREHPVPDDPQRRLDRLRLAVEQVAGVLGSYTANPLGGEAAALLREVLAVDAAGDDPTDLGG